MSSRNVFENHSVGLNEEDNKKLSGKAYSMMPPLAEGYHYELVKVSAGVAVVVEED